MQAALPLASGAVSFGGWALYTALTLVVVLGFMGMARTGFNSRIFTNLPARLAEHLHGFLESLILGAIGSHGRKYIPLITTFWTVIFASNVIALFFPASPTTILSFNLGMALISIGYVQYEGIRTNGFFGHLSHFAGPKLGWKFALLNILLFGIEIISEVMKNLSLSIRLFANMRGGHQAVEKINDLGYGLIHEGWGMPFYLPFGELLLPLKILTCLVQALIFSLLTCVYLGLVTHHDHGDEAHAH